MFGLERGWVLCRHHPLQPTKHGKHRYKWHFRGKTLTDKEHFALKRYILSSTFNLSYELRSDVLTLRDNVAERIFAYQAKIRQRKIAKLDVGFEHSLNSHYHRTGKDYFKIHFRNLAVLL